MNAQELLLALLTAHFNNARIYEYLLGALLLETHDRGAVETEMLKQWQKSTTYLDTAPRDLEHSRVREAIYMLRTELNVNKQLVQRLRTCQTDIYVRHEIGVPVLRCSSKWAFQDFPELLDCIESPYQSLSVLCKHVIDKYECCQDPNITPVLKKIEINYGFPSFSLEHAPTTKTSPTITELETIGVKLKTLDFSSSIVKDINNNDIDKGRIRKLRARLRECLDQIKSATAYKNDSSKQHAGVRLDTETTHPEKELQPDNVPYWVPNLYQNTPCQSKDNGAMNLSPNCNSVAKRTPIKVYKPNIFDKKKCVIQDSSVLAEHGFESSPCAVRCSKMVPLKTPVRKSKLDIAFPQHESPFDEKTIQIPGPYVKPLFRKRTSLVPDTNTEESKEKWEKFYSHLQKVRLRVIKRINTQFSPKSRLSKRKKQKKHRRRRKSKKNAEPESVEGKTGSNDSFCHVVDNGDTSGNIHTEMECAS